MDNEDLILKAAKDTGVFKTIVEGVPTGACDYPLFVLESEDDIEIDSAVDPLLTKYNTEYIYSVIIVSRVKVGSAIGIRSAKKEINTNIKDFLGKLGLLIAHPENNKFRLISFERFPFNFGGKNTMVGLARIGREEWFDLE